MSPALLDTLHHVAISVKSVPESVAWYRETFNCEIAYEDSTWALLKFGNISLALVIPEQHPPHLGFVSERASEFGQLKTHRDGTKSCYIADPSGNSVELLAADSV